MTHLELAVCDYPEHVPRGRWPVYARLQRELGLSYVRIAEFAWSRIEPREGQFEWAWLDEAVGAYAAEGLKIVLCTPTATPPAWLVRAHPEILPVDAQGRLREFGSRRHYDFASPVYREHSRRITRAVAGRYGQHPAVAGWQTDNEFACHATGRSYGGASAAAFPRWLEKRYGSLDALNEAWGNVFWSQEYTAWDQIRPPNLTVTEPNPSHVLDFYRFASDMVRDFQAEQVAILRECSPGRFVTHNFMIFESDFDHYAAARGLDFVSWDNYPTGMLEYFSGWAGEETKTKFARTGHPDLISFNHDLYRGLLQRPFWVMEQQCGQVNWAPYNPLPAHGAVGLWTAQSWAHGADVVSYFRWRAATMSQEVLHSGLLRHDETPDRGFGEVAELDLQQFLSAPVAAPVALLHDYESLWALDQQPQGGPGYCEQVMLYYSALRSLGFGVDVIHPDTDLSPYRLIVAPALTLMNNGRMKKLLSLANTRPVVFGPRTAFRTSTGRAHEEGQFGSFKDAFGVRCLNFESLRPGLTLRAGGHGAGGHDIERWAEGYEPRGAAVLAHYESGPLQGQAAATRKNGVTVIGAHSSGLVSEILRDLSARIGLHPLDLPGGVRISRRGNQQLIMNWNSAPTEYEGQTLPGVSYKLG